jgi:hypothetical protein
MQMAIDTGMRKNQLSLSYFFFEMWLSLIRHMQSSDMQQGIAFSI